MVRYQKELSPTHSYPDYHTSSINFFVYYNPQHPPCSIYILDSPFPQLLRKLNKQQRKINYSPRSEHVLTEPPGCQHLNAQTTSLACSKIPYYFQSSYNHAQYLPPTFPSVSQVTAASSTTVISSQVRRCPSNNNSAWWTRFFCL